MNEVYEALCRLTGKKNPIIEALKRTNYESLQTTVKRKLEIAGDKEKLKLEEIEKNIILINKEINELKELLSTKMEKSEQKKKIDNKLDSIIKFKFELFKKYINSNFSIELVEFIKDVGITELCYFHLACKDESKEGGIPNPERVISFLQAEINRRHENETFKNQSIQNIILFATLIIAIFVNFKNCSYKKDKSLQNIKFIKNEEATNNISPKEPKFILSKTNVIESNHNK